MHFCFAADKNESIARKTAMSSSESSSIVDQGSCSASDYEIEDECCEMTSNIEYEEDPSYVSEEEFLDHVDSLAYTDEPLADDSWLEEEFLDHVDSLAYTDEPLADDSWLEEYLTRQEERDREMTELTLRLNSQNPVNTW